MASLSRRSFLAQSAAAAAAQAKPRPNILWISCEDMSPQMGCYGDPLAITPNLDRLASQGVRFRHAYSIIGVCAPSRSGIITGVHPTSLGSHHMRCSTAIPAHIRCFPEYLREAGYYCTNNSKTDYNFPVPKSAWDESSNRAHWKNRPAGKPFFAVFNLTITHESRILPRGDEHAAQTRRLKPGERRDPARVAAPPYYPDTPEVRRDLANVHETITQMDYLAGDLLAEIEQAGLASDTIVFFWSDHGVGLPRSKRWLYDSSTHVPLIVRIPEKFRSASQGRPTSASDQLVSLIDLGPTVLNLAGVAVPSHMHGQAFLGPNTPAPRRYVYGARDRMDERYDVVRAVFDGRFRYIRNFDWRYPHYQYMNTPERGPTMRELRRLHDQGKLRLEADRYFFPKPVEELYETAADPHETANLAARTEHKATLERLRQECLRWMKATGDLGLIAEPELEELGRQAGTRHQILARNPGLQDQLLEAAHATDSGDAVRLQTLLENNSAAVRARALAGLSTINGGRPAEASARIERALKDSSPAVRVAAARILAAADHPAALQVLVKELENQAEWVRLAAAQALDELGDRSRSALPALEKTAGADSNRYVVRVANRTVNRLTGRNNEVA
jgi:uncharacterized sulfatase